LFLIEQGFYRAINLLITIGSSDPARDLQFIDVGAELRQPNMDASTGDRFVVFACVITNP